MSKTYRRNADDNGRQRRNHADRQRARDLARELDAWQRGDASPDDISEALTVAGYRPRRDRTRAFD